MESTNDRDTRRDQQQAVQPHLGQHLAALIDMGSEPARRRAESDSSDQETVEPSHERHLDGLDRVFDRLGILETRLAHIQQEIRESSERLERRILALIDALAWDEAALKVGHGVNRRVMRGLAKAATNPETEPAAGVRDHADGT